MGSLQEFLANQAENLKVRQAEAARKRDEWTAAVDGLTAQIRDWLTQADPAHVLEIQNRRFEIREEGIGTYDVDGLSIALGPREVRVEPIARNVAGRASMTGVISVARAYGRVDLTNGLTRFMIFRVEKDPTDRWNIVEQDGFRMQPFDRQALESAIQSLLE